MIYITTYILSLLDLFLTLYFTKKYGIDIEANPLGRLMLQKTRVAVLVKVVIVGIAILLLYIFRRYKVEKIGITVCIIVYSLLLIYHVILMLITVTRKEINA